jgi:hypothetical protein
VISVYTELLVQRVVPIGKVFRYLVTLRSPSVARAGSYSSTSPSWGADCSENYF